VTSKASYSNVTITAKSDATIFIRHQRGVANVKVEDLDSTTQQALGYQVMSAESGSFGGSDSKVMSAVKHYINAIAAQKRSLFNDSATRVASPSVQINPSIVAGILTGVLLTYLFFCGCCAAICRKTGTEPGILIWIPVFQLIPLLRAAGMSGWWFLAFFVPVLNLLAHILWCVNIVRARDKSILWAPLLLFPVTNILALLYLASSSNASASDSRVSVVVKSEAALGEA
jgi:hypothetical protein